MKQIYHTWDKWEDHQHGFYDSCPQGEKENLLKLAVEMFNSEHATYQNMQRVVDEWKYSCEHNLTNTTMNRVAWLGQSACCLYARIPSTVTMEAWSLLSPEVQERSNQIAESRIRFWEINYLKSSQLCINLN